MKNGMKKKKNVLKKINQDVKMMKNLMRKHKNVKNNVKEEM
jgi:glutaredoxin 2